MVDERTKELEHARTTLKAILDTAPIGILVVDAKTNRVIYHSSGVEKIFGGPLVGKIYGVDMYPHQILHLDRSLVQNEDMPLYISLTSGEQVSDMEFIIRQQNGDERNVLVRSAPIKDEQGKVTSAVAAIIDITELKKVESELQESKVEAEMYLDLMGHDINNLSQVGFGYLELVLNELKPKASSISIASRCWRKRWRHS